MPKVTIVNEKKEIEVPAGSNLRQEAMKAGVEVYPGIHKYLDPAFGLCGSCKVYVKKGDENVSGKTLMERINLNLHPMTSFAAIGHETEIRLACQMKVNGDCSVEVQGPSSTSAATTGQAVPEQVTGPRMIPAAPGQGRPRHRLVAGHQRDCPLLREAEPSSSCNTFRPRGREQAGSGGRGGQVRQGPRRWRRRSQFRIGRGDVRQDQDEGRPARHPCEQRRRAPRPDHSQDVDGRVERRAADEPERRVSLLQMRRRNAGRRRTNNQCRLDRGNRRIPGQANYGAAKAGIWV